MNLNPLKMVMELIWLFFKLILFIISLVSWIAAIFLTIFIIIFVIILIKRRFKTKKNVDPKGKAVLITGCDSGFGYQFALKINSLGYRVYATVLNGDSASNLKQKSESKEQMVVWKMDVTNDEEVKEVYLKVKHDLEGNDCILWSVVNNAGYGILAQIEWVDLAHFKRLFDVNVFGLVRVTKTFLPLIRQSKGRIVNLSSVFGFFSANGYGPYCMSKHAVTAFTDTLRREMHKFGVKVSALYPGGYSDTNFTKTLLTSCDQTWDQLDESIKNSYKESYSDWKMMSFSRLENGTFDKSEQVIDALVDSVTNSDPKHSYQPNDNIIGWLLVALFRYLPNCIVDKLDNF